MTGDEIREAFLRYFEAQGHTRVRSSSLVPGDDPTLLFTNAGMVQFKGVFLGEERPGYVRATTAQKCVRAGGKHNDLENVGRTARHHTFFEMLGNFSFGDYFKADAITFAWQFLTRDLAIDRARLMATVFTDDDDAFALWKKVAGFGDDRVLRLGEKDNFWAMGDTGPCGPCSEIHYDMGVKAIDNPQKPECSAGTCPFPCDCGRYVEIWNLVFMQFNRDASGFTQLARPSIDTGMGLERVAAVLQGVISNYDTDLFLPLMKRAAELCGVDYDKEIKSEAGKGGAASLRVIADHARATTFLITDGVVPSNEGRGYVLRKIMRRAIYHGRLLGCREPFFHMMVPEVVRVMTQPIPSVPYPELVDSAEHVERIVHGEENRFLHTLEAGLEMLEKDIRVPKAAAALAEVNNLEEQVEAVFGADLKEQVVEELKRTLPGERAFKLYDTYGLPRDFIEDVLRDAGVSLDAEGFERAMQEQRTRARASWKGGAGKEAANPAYAKLAETFKTEPDFYHGTSVKDSRIEAIFYTGEKGPAGSRRYENVNELKAGESGEVVLNRTAIYAESGGQVADTGAFYDNSESQLLAEVTGAFYPVAGLVAHKVVAKETLRVGDRVAVVADAERRGRIIRNHSGTHLVNAALRNILGTHVKQSGSLNAPERLRFDFSHFAHVDAEELRDIEQQVNEEIRLNTEIETNVTSLEEALASGALAFFGDKYPEHNVRVVTIPDPRAARGFYSKELCGGTHVQRVGDIGVLKIVSEESVAAGVRRIEAVTGIGALEHYQQQAQTLRQVANQLNVGEDGLLAQVEKLAQTAKQLEKELEAQKRKGALSQVDELAGRVQVVKGIKVIAAEVHNVDREGLRQLVDSLRQKLGSGVVALGMPEDGKVALIAGVTRDLTAKVHAGKLMQALAPMVGGKGGGRPDLAEAGGKDTTGLKTALQSVPSLLEALL